MVEEKKFRNDFHNLLNMGALFLLDMLVPAQRHLLLASKCQNRCSRKRYCLNKQITWDAKLIFVLFLLTQRTVFLGVRLLEENLLIVRQAF